MMKRTPDYVAIDYNFVLPDTFDDPIRRECRGIKFKPSGEILARPLHKFFNVGERPETQENKIDWNRITSLQEKLDGSMIHFTRVGGELRAMTRKGITEISEACEEACRDMLSEPALWTHYNALTAVYEWTSPSNRIVVPYKKDRLTLLAVRNNKTGEYLRSPFDVLGVPRTFPIPSNLKELLKKTEDLENQEGFVAWGRNGPVVKLKSPWYVVRHRILSEIRYEHHILRLVVEQGTDDIIGFLDQETKKNLKSFTFELHYSFGELIKRIRKLIFQYHPNRKEFALAVQEKIARSLRPVAFLIWDGVDEFEALKRVTRGYVQSQTKAAKFLDDLGGPRWKM